MKRVLTVGCIAVFLCLLSFPALAFVREKTETGKELWWRKQPIEYTIHANGLGDYFTKNPKQGAVGSEFSAITLSFSAWEVILCNSNPIGLKFQSRGRSTTATAGFDQNNPQNNTNLIVFVRDRAGWKHNQNQLGVTTTIYDKDTGEIFDADIEINAVDFQFSTQITDKQNMRWDLQSVLTHEIGHFIGLGHSNILEATMAPTGDQGDIGLRSLHSDDFQGACTIYPPKTKLAPAPTYKQVDANRGLGCSTLETPAPLWGGLVLLWMVLVGRRRKQNRN